MDSKLAFQILPSTVILKTINESCSPHDYTAIHNESARIRRLLWQLSHTCCTWRSVALGKLHFNYYLLFKNDCVKFSVGKANEQFVSCEYILPYINYIRHCHVTISGAGGFSSALKYFGSMSSNRIFAGATTASIKIYESSILKENAEIGYETIKKLGANIKSALPSLSIINMDIISPCNTNNLNWSLVGKLFRIVSNNIDTVRLTIQSDSLPIQSADCSFPTQLTSLNCHWNENYENTVHLLHANHASLRAISILFFHTENLQHMFRKSDGSPVVYPRMNHLNFLPLVNSTVTLVEPINNITPFPRLKTVHMHIMYPFSDDIIFRGNYRALDHLDLNATDSTIVMLDNAGVFSHFTLYNLKTLILQGVASCTKDAEDSKSVLVRLVAGSPFLIKLVIFDFEIAELFLNIPRENFKLGNLSSLNLSQAHLSLLGAIKVFQCIPTVQFLVSHISIIDADLEFDSVGELLKLIRDTYSLKKSQLSTWLITNMEFISLTESLVCLLCIADGCPHFCRAVFDEVDSEAARDMLSIIYNSQLYAMCKENFTIKPMPGMDMYWQICR